VLHKRLQHKNNNTRLKFTDEIVFYPRVLYSRVGKENSNSLLQNSDAAVHVEKALKIFYRHEKKVVFDMLFRNYSTAKCVLPKLNELKASLNNGKTRSYIACSRGTSCHPKESVHYQIKASISSPISKLCM